LRLIDQQQCTGSASEEIDMEFHESTADSTNSANPAHQVAGLIPAFEGAGAARAGPEDELIGLDLEGIFSGLHEYRFTRGFKKTLYSFAGRRWHHSKLVAAARQNINSFFEERCFSSSFRSPK
jgi:hypothetical protein